MSYQKHLYLKLRNILPESNRAYRIKILKKYVRYLYKCEEKNKNIRGYSEVHHGLPVSLFPKYKSLKKHPWNKFILTSRQHFIAHKFLAKIYGGKMYHALWAMANGQQKSRKGELKVSSKEYEKIKEEYSKFQSKDKSGKRNGMYGRNHTEETKKKISKNITDREERARRMRDGWKDAEISAKRIKGMIGKKRTTVVCPHCSLKIGSNIANQYHFDNCKSNPSREPIPRVSCIYCKKEGEVNMSFSKWHFSNCRHKGNPNYEKLSKMDKDSIIIATCPHCGKTGSKPHLVPHHFDNCKDNTSKMNVTEIKLGK